MTRGPQIAGLLTGLALAAVLVLLARPAAGPPLGLDLFVTATGSGEVEAAPSGRFLTARALRPGGRASGDVVLRNITGVRRGIRVTLAGPKEADARLRVRLVTDGTVLYDGTLAGLRSGAAPPLVLAAGRRARLELQAWVPAGDAHTALGGRSADLAMTFTGGPAR